MQAKNPAGAGPASAPFERCDAIIAGRTRRTNERSCLPGEETAEAFALKQHGGQGEVYVQGFSVATGLKVRKVVFVYCKAGAEVRLRDGEVVR